MKDELRNIADSIIDAAIKAVLPDEAVKRALENKEFAGKVTPKQVWDSITLWTFQSKFLNKERKLMPMLSCPKCGILKQGVPEDIDKYVDEILDKM